MCMINSKYSAINFTDILNQLSIGLGETVLREVLKEKSDIVFTKETKLNNRQKDKILCLHRIYKLLTSYESLVVSRNWFLVPNPWLNDFTPSSALGKGYLTETFQAAENFVK